MSKAKKIASRMRGTFEYTGMIDKGVKPSAKITWEDGRVEIFTPEFVNTSGVFPRIMGFICGEYGTRVDFDADVTLDRDGRLRHLEDIWHINEGREIGIISQKTESRGKPVIKVKWEDGSTETLSTKVASELGNLSVGQRFEADITNRWQKGHRRQVLKVENVRQLNPLPRISKDEIKALWDSIPGTNSLPAAGWD